MIHADGDARRNPIAATAYRSAECRVTLR